MYSFFLLVSYIILSFPQVFYAMDIKPSSPHSPRKQFANLSVIPGQIRTDYPEHKTHFDTLYRTSSDSVTQSNSADRLSFFKSSNSSSSSISPKGSPRTKNQKKKLSKEDKNYNKLMHAVRHNDTQRTRKLLNKHPEIDLNKPKGIGNNTVYHFAVLGRNEEIIDACLEQPGINSLVQNEDGRMAHELFGITDIQESKELQNKLTSRAFLDLIIHAMILIYPKVFMDQDCACDVILNTIQAVKKNLPAHTFPKYASITFIIQMIYTHLKDNLSMQIFLNAHKENPNKQDDLGNTMLHYAACLHSPKQINRLISNPHIDSSIKNNAGKIPHELILKEDKYLTLRTLLFTSYCLTSITKKETEVFLLQNPINKKLSLEDSSVRTSMENIKSEYKRMIQSQVDDRALPKECELPEHATDEFICAKLEYYIAERKQNQSFEFNTQKDESVVEIQTVDSEESLYL